MNPPIEPEQCQRLTQLRAGRDNAEGEKHLAAITEAAQGDAQFALPDESRTGGKGDNW